MEVCPDGILSLNIYVFTYAYAAVRHTIFKLNSLVFYYPGFSLE